MPKNIQDFEYKLKKIRDNATGDKVSFHRAGLNDEDCLRLCEALQKNTSVKQLYLRNNHIGDAGAAALAKALAVNKSLTSLKSPTAEIAKGLAKNTAIKELNLRRNKIGNEGAAAIAKMLENNTCVTSVNLGYNRIGNEGAKAMADMLGKNNSVESINLFANAIGNEGAKAIADMLGVNKHLTSLNMSWNRQITDKGWAEIAKGLAENTSVTSVNLRGYKISEKGETVIAGMLMVNSTLEIMVGLPEDPMASRLCNVNAILAKARRRDQVDPIEHEQALLERGGFRFPEHRFLEPKEIWKELILGYMKAHDGLIAVEGAGALPAQEIERLKSTMGTRDYKISEESLLSKFAKLSS